MARHWSAFVTGLTERQAYALDKMGQAHGIGDGMDVLTKIARCSRSKIGQMDRLTLRHVIDKAFEQFGRKQS